MVKHEIEIYIIDIENVCAYIPLIRKSTIESISNIREKIIQKKPVVICQYTKNPDELIEIYDLLNTLIDKGAQIKIVQNIKNKILREIDMDVVSNLIQRRKEINQEVVKVMDMENAE